MKNMLLALMLVVISSNSHAYDTAVPFTSDYFAMCLKAEHLDSLYYDQEAKEGCRLLPMANYEVVGERDDKVRITYKGNWTAWVYRNALVIQQEE